MQMEEVSQQNYQLFCKFWMIFGTYLNINQLILCFMWMKNNFNLVDEW